MRPCDVMVVATIARSGRRQGSHGEQGDLPVTSVRTRLTHSAVVAAALLTVAVSACSSSGSKAATTTSGSTTPSSTTLARPAGPAATIAPMEGGKGTMLLSPVAGPDLAKAGYVQEEYEASGNATAYSSNGPMPKNGHLELAPSTKAPYATRIVVRRPKEAKNFNGTVVVEWNNVSGGLDVAPDWTYTADEIVRSGYAWVGVSAQSIGIEGGTVAVSTPLSDLGGAGKGIKHLDPARYGKLHHPGDAYSYDLYTQVARALRASGPTGPLGGLHATHLLAMGESQSAFALTTYYDGVQPLTHAFDGFLVHSRGGAAQPLGDPGKATDIAAAITGSPMQFRTDLKVPVITVETETDVVGILNYDSARQPDNPQLRVWEVAGTSHVDAYQLGPVSDQFGCSKPVNAGPDHFVVAAALAALDRWAVDGIAPPHAPRLEVTPDRKAYELDANGNAKGGIRTPQVDVPVDVLSGLPSPGASVACILAGSTTPIPSAKLAELYPSRADYLTRYTKATDAAIKAGFVLPADRKTMLADAQPDRIGS